MRERGYAGPTLRISARVRGGVARFVNDRWAPPPLPQRRPNVFMALVFDPKAMLPMMVLFASETIPKGAEALLDYGPAYWRVAAHTLIREHALSCSDSLRTITHLRRALEALQLQGVSGWASSSSEGDAD